MSLFALLLLACKTTTKPVLVAPVGSTILPPPAIVIPPPVVVDGDQVSWPVPGDATYQSRLYPPLEYVSADAKTKYGITTYADIIRHFTEQSIAQDALTGTVSVTEADGLYTITVTTTDTVSMKSFGERHVDFLSGSRAGLALYGADLCKDLGGCWNPMADYPVNTNPSDGRSKWNPYLPLGMGILQHRSVLLMHYPPWVALQEVDYLHNNTLERWQRLLGAVGTPAADMGFYETVLDVNPIAAPGSGESEYNNDYFPILLASSFFANERLGATYIPSMLTFLTQPPSTVPRAQTLPLLVGGSPLYDPQAPAWFRAHYKEQLQPNHDEQVPWEILQAGTVSVATGMKPTPYMATNHMIAAGVTGTCTDDPTQIPDMRQYEAQDLVAACWIEALTGAPEGDPVALRDQCCTQYYEQVPGQPACGGTPKSLESICWLAQKDLFFDEATVSPACSDAQAQTWCTTTAIDYNPCPSDWKTNNCTTVPPSE